MWRLTPSLGIQDTELKRRAVCSGGFSSAQSPVVDVTYLAVSLLAHLDLKLLVFEKTGERTNEIFPLFPKVAYNATVATK